MAMRQKYKKMAITQQPLMLDAKFFFLLRCRIPKFLSALNALYKPSGSIFQVKSKKHVFSLFL